MRFSKELLLRQEVECSQPYAPLDDEDDEPRSVSRKHSKRISIHIGILILIGFFFSALILLCCSLWLQLSQLHASIQNLQPDLFHSKLSLFCLDLNRKAKCENNSLEGLLEI